MHIPRCLFYFLISFPSPLCSLVCIHCARQQRWKSFLIYALGEIRSMKVQKSTHPTRITNTKQGLAQTWQHLRCAFECLKYILHVDIWYFILIYWIFICMYIFDILYFYIWYLFACIHLLLHVAVLPQGILDLSWVSHSIQMQQEPGSRHCKAGTPELFI